MQKHIAKLNTIHTIASDVTPFSRAKIAAGIYKKNRLVSVGVNCNKTHPIQLRFKKNDHAIFLHAEINCIVNHIKHFGEEDLQGSTMYVARSKMELTAKGNGYDEKWGLAAPCEGCMKALKYYGIKRVIYTTNNDNEIGTLEI